VDPKWTKVIAVVVVLVLVVAGVAFYYVRTHGGGSNCSLGSKSPLIIDQAETPDYADPATSDSTPGWALIQQVYQGLVNYQGANTTIFAGVLAHNWTVSTDQMNWTFTLRSGVTFSNGDPYNAYVQWFSLYRALVMNQAPGFILSQNFWFPNESWYASDGVSENWNTSVVNTLVNELDTFDFAGPSSTELAVMEAPNQSFQVLNSSAIELHLGYAYLLATLASPVSYAVDPAVVQQNGKVVANTTNSWMDVHMVGTGQYTLVGTYDSTGSGYTLDPSTSYWGANAAAANPANNLLPPAKSAIQVDFQSTAQIAVQDLEDGAAAEASFSYLGPTTVQSLAGNSCVTVQTLPPVFGSTAGSWWIYMNQSTPPFNNLSVRAAVVHAINYSQIIQDAFGGAAQQWVGPVPPGFPDYNPNNLAPYSYNLALAKQEIADSPCANGACANQGINFEYVAIGDWESVVTVLKSNLQQIGLTLNPEKLSSIAALYNLQSIDPSTGLCTAQSSSGGQGPFPMGLEFYTADYVSPDDYTQNDAYTYGSANMCMSGYSNSTVNNDTFDAASATDPATAAQLYGNITSAMYDNYTDAWLVVPTQYAVFSDHLHGIVDNAMGSAEPVCLTLNTEYAT